MSLAFNTVEIRTSSSFNASSRSERRLDFSFFINSNLASNSSLSFFSLAISVSAIPIATARLDNELSFSVNSKFEVRSFAISSLPLSSMLANEFSFSFNSELSASSFESSPRSKAADADKLAKLSLSLAFTACSCAKSALSSAVRTVIASTFSLNTLFSIDSL